MLRGSFFFFLRSIVMINKKITIQQLVALIYEPMGLIYTKSISELSIQELYKYIDYISHSYPFTLH